MSLQIPVPVAFGDILDQSVISFGNFSGSKFGNEIETYGWIPLFSGRTGFSVILLSAPCRSLFACGVRTSPFVFGCFSKERIPCGVFETISDHLGVAPA